MSYKVSSTNSCFLCPRMEAWLVGAHEDIFDIELLPCIVAAGIWYGCVGMLHHLDITPLLGAPKCNYSRL